MEQFKKLKKLVETAEAQYSKFCSASNKSAGTRARKDLQEIKSIAQDIRIKIQAMKNKDQ